MKMLDFLEDVDVKPYTLENPLKGEILFRKQIHKDNDSTITYHLTINNNGKLRYLEGQSIGILSPATDGTLKEERFTIASSRYGDDKKGNTVSITIKSNNPISKLKSGDEVTIAGPYSEDNDCKSSKSLFAEQEGNSFDTIMITSKDISPFRSYLHRLFIDNTRIRYNYQGQINLLFLDEENPFDLPYGNELQAIANDYPDKFKVFSSNGVDEGNRIGMVDKLNNGAYLYVSGTANMYDNVKDILKKEYMKQDGFEDWFTNLEKKQQ